jgi:hypothetical protein
LKPFVSELIFFLAVYFIVSVFKESTRVILNYFLYFGGKKDFHANILIKNERNACDRLKYG